MKFVENLVDGCCQDSLNKTEVLAAFDATRDHALQHAHLYTEE
jgi:hypothetical protein